MAHSLSPRVQRVTQCQRHLGFYFSVTEGRVPQPPRPGACSETARQGAGPVAGTRAWLLVASACWCASSAAMRTSQALDFRIWGLTGRLLNGL